MRQKDLQYRGGRRGAEGPCVGAFFSTLLGGVRVDRLAAVLVFASAALPPASGEELRYAVLLAGRRVGLQTTTLLPRGERRYTYEFSDRGRGPKLTSRVLLAPDGTLTSIETTGHDYLKTPVEEHLAVVPGRATWRNRGEAGEKALTAPSQYLSFDGVPEELALLARRLLRSPEGRIALLPEGEARIERVGELEAKGASGTRTVVQYAVSGLDFAPSRVWLDREGGFFAVASSWFSVVREGWEGALPELVAAQDRAAELRNAALVAAAVRLPPRSLVFRNVRVFDADAAVAREGMTVVVTGGLIAALGEAGKVPVPNDAEVVDGAGRTLIPGLWDMHTHVSDGDGPLQIAAGVTTVRDLANDVDTLAGLRKAWDERRAVGPRVIPAGFIDGPGPYQGPTKVLAGTLEEGLAAVGTYAQLGYPQVKLYSSLRPELVAPLAAEAHRRGMRVSGHIPAFMTAEQAVRAGYDEIQHVNMLFLNFWADTLPDTRTPARFTAVAEGAADLDLGSERVRAFLGLLQERGTVVDPTLSIFEGMLTDRPRRMAAGYATVAERLPATVRRGFLGGGLPVPEGRDERYRGSFRALLRMVKLLEERGIPIVAGTDALAGFALHRELELYVEAGIPPARVLQIATLSAARVMKRDAELGSIAVGKRADLVLVEGNPAERIADVRRTALVVKDGAVYSPAAVYQELGVRP